MIRIAADAAAAADVDAGTNGAEGLYMELVEAVMDLALGLGTWRVGLNRNRDLNQHRHGNCLFISKH